MRGAREMMTGRRLLGIGRIGIMHPRLFGVGGRMRQDQTEACADADRAPVPEHHLLPPGDNLVVVAAACRRNTVRTTPRNTVFRIAVRRIVSCVSCLAYRVL